MSLAVRHPASKLRDRARACVAHARIHAVQSEAAAALARSRSRVRRDPLERFKASPDFVGRCGRARGSRHCIADWNGKGVKDAGKTATEDFEEAKVETLENGGQGRGNMRESLQTLADPLASYRLTYDEKFRERSPKSHSGFAWRKQKHSTVSEPVPRAQSRWACYRAPRVRFIRSRFGYSQTHHQRLWLGLREISERGQAMA